jgi:glucose-1-phosphate thymidylyltransferase
MNDMIGLLPAGGKASRLKSFRYPKELLPVYYESERADSSYVYPHTTSETSLALLGNAGITRCLMVIAPWKQSLIHYHGSGADYGLSISYLCQDLPQGLPHAIDLACPWLSEHSVALVMPDTIVRPADSLTKLVESHRRTGADVTLGVFPSLCPESLAPVILNKYGYVTAILDKHPAPPVNNTWGIAVWQPTFTKLLHEELAKSELGSPEPILSDFFLTAMSRGLCVRGEFFPNGQFHDLGTPASLKSYLCAQPVSFAEVG